MGMPLKVLIVEDSEDDAEMLAFELRRNGFVPTWRRVESGEAMRGALEDEEWDVVLADYKLPQFDVPTALDVLRESGLDLPFIVVSGVIRMEDAVTLMRAGAHDFVDKHNLARLVPAVERELREVETRRKRREAEEALRTSEARLSEAQRIARLGCWDWNIETDELWWSDEVYRILGLKPQECGATYDAFLRSVHPDDRDFVENAVAAALNMRVLYNIECRIILPNGLEKIIHEQGEVTFDDSGTPIRMTGTIQDITRRKQAEEALRESGERFRAIAEATPVPLFISRLSDSVVLYANPRVGSALGLRPDEVVGQKSLDFYQDPAERNALLETVKKEGYVRNYELELHKEDGTRITALLSLQAMTFEDEPAILTGFYDITERKRAEESLIKANRALRTLIICDKALVHAKTEDQLLSDICRLIVELGGYRLAWVGFAEENEAKSVRPAAQFGFEEGYLKQLNITWADNERGRGPTGTAIRTGKPSLARNIPEDPNFMPWRAKALKRGYASALALPLLAGEKAFGALNIYASEPDAFDEDEVDLLTGLVNNLAYGILALRESEQRVRSVMENVADGVITIDEKGVIESFNPAAEKVFGYAADEVVGQKVNMLMPSPDRERHDSYIEAYLRTSRGALLGTGPREVSALRKNGTSFPMDLACSEMVLGGKRRFIGVMRDITERRQTQAQLIQSSKLATLGEMATAMAHELNQPLNVIRMAADNTLERIEEGKADAAYLQGKLERISDQIERAARIIDHMRIFGRRADEEPEKFDPRKVVENALGLMGEQLRLRSIEVETAFPEHCRGVLGHALQLEQVVLNLLTNARDAIEANRTSPGAPGIISLSVEDLGPEDRVRLIVEDSGGGIPEEVLPRIFEPFYTTKKKGEGTGLGLSVSYGIVRDMGGAIEAANVGEGAQFTVTLPVVETKKNGMKSKGSSRAAE